MFGEPPLWIACIEDVHQFIPGCLRQDGSGHDLGYAGVTFDHRLARDRHSRCAISIHQNQCDYRLCWVDSLKSPLHGRHGCLEDIGFIDFTTTGPSYAPSCSPFHDYLANNRAAFGRHPFRVIQKFDGETGRQHHRSRADRSCNRTSSGFIDSAYDLHGRIVAHKQVNANRMFATEFVQPADSWYTFGNLRRERSRCS